MEVLGLTVRQQRLTINAETVGNAQSNDFPGHWPGEDHSWDLDYFRDVCISMR